jgi:hypothetical protein
MEQECVAQHQSKEDSSFSLSYIQDWWFNSTSKCNAKCVADARIPLPKCYEQCSEEFRGRKLRARYHDPKQAQYQPEHPLFHDSPSPTSSSTSSATNENNANHDKTTTKESNEI